MGPQRAAQIAFDGGSCSVQACAFIPLGMLNASLHSALCELQGRCFLEKRCAQRVSGAQ